MDPHTMEAHFARNPDVREFYERLSSKDKIIHELAAKMLKTRYTPERSNAWKAQRAAAKK